MRCKTVLAVCAAFLTNIGGCASAKTAVITRNNVLLRDSPEKDYVVEMILHRGCRVERDPAPTDGILAHIRFQYADSLGETHCYFGWVAKRYLTYDTLMVANRKNGPAFTVAPLIPYGGGKEHNPNKDNRRNYPAGRYRGGDPQPAPWVKKYESGSRGGCYYWNANGRKVYVDKKFCNPKGNGVPPRHVKNTGQSDFD